jgi:hypothetical protein
MCTNLAAILTLSTVLSAMYFIHVQHVLTASLGLATSFDTLCEESPVASDILHSAYLSAVTCAALPASSDTCTLSRITEQVQMSVTVVVGEHILANDHPTV